MTRLSLIAVLFTSMFLVGCGGSTQNVDVSDASQDKIDEYKALRDKENAKIAPKQGGN